MMNYGQAHSDQSDPDKAAIDYSLNDEPLPQCPPNTTERKLVLRMDFHIIPPLCILYLMCFLDRVNIGSAVVYGLTKDLRLVGDQYNTALVIFYVPYVLLEIPCNLLMKKISPRTWLSVNMFLFGLVVTMQGLVQNYSGLLATRFFLGVFECAIFPGCFYLIGMWYTRAEAQRRFSFFFSSTTLAGGFGGLLAAAIGKMNGLRGYAGWRWIFILEGALTVALAVLLFFWIPAFPEKASWLSPDERTYVSAKLKAEQGQAAIDRSVTIRDVWTVVRDIKVQLAGFMYLALIIPAYAYAYFSPSIINGYGYGPIETQLHSVPPWAAAFGFTMLLAVLSDYTKHRFAYAVFSIAIGIAGFAILLAVHHHVQVQYAALFLVAMGIYAAGPIVVCWHNMNLGGHVRRSVGGGWQIGFGNIGGFIAVFSFLAKDAPRYTAGYSICIAFAALGLLTCVAYALACWFENHRRDRTPIAQDLDEAALTALGDKSPFYRYLL